MSMEAWAPRLAIGDFIRINFCAGLQGCRQAMNECLSSNRSLLFARSAFRNSLLLVQNSNARTAIMNAIGPKSLCTGDRSSGDHPASAAPICCTISQLASSELV